jgi:hypothetical protein
MSAHSERNATTERATSEIACESGQAEQVHIRVYQKPQPQIIQAENLIRSLLPINTSLG